MTTHYISVQGIRGGVGSTSILAGLAYALQDMGKRVLLIDMTPSNLLRLHFNVPYMDNRGWARAQLDGQDWMQHAWQAKQHQQLFLLPYGQLSFGEQRAHERWLDVQAAPWNGLDKLQPHFDWVLFDLSPHHQELHKALHKLPIHTLSILHADMACHALLHQVPRHGRHFLINHYDPSIPLQRDLLLIWQQQMLSEHLAPVHIHADTALQEALAYKAPIGYYAPQSQAALDIQTLATWCLTCPSTT